jgi:hypothetical protein
MSVETHSVMMSREENIWFVYQSFLVILSKESSSSKQEERAKGMTNLALQSIFVRTRKWYFYMP